MDICRFIEVGGRRMSKYKLGDKVVLTVTDTNEMGCLPCYVLNDDLILSRQDIDKYTESLTAYTEPLEDKIKKLMEENIRLIAENTKLKAKGDVLKTSCDDYEEKANDMCDTARAEGQEEAWELARKIAVVSKEGGCTGRELIEIFNTVTISKIFSLTYPEAAAKVSQWEKAKEEIKVGDIYRSEAGNYFAIRTTDGEKGVAKILFMSNGEVTPDYIKSYCTKTGRHIDIDGFLKQIGGNGNER